MAVLIDLETTISILQHKLGGKNEVKIHLQGRTWTKRTCDNVLKATSAPLAIFLQFSQYFSTWLLLHYITRPRPRLTRILMISH